LGYPTSKKRLATERNPKHQGNYKALVGGKEKRGIFNDKGE